MPTPSLVSGIKGTLVSVGIIAIAVEDRREVRTADFTYKQGPELKTSKLDLVACDVDKSLTLSVGGKPSASVTVDALKPGDEIEFSGYPAVWLRARRP